MSNLFTALPVPPGNGVGAAVDLSTYGALKTIVVTGTALRTLNIEFNNDPLQAGSWQSVATISGGGMATVNVACQWMRVRSSGFFSGTSTVNVGGTDAGTSFAALPVPVGDGVGAAVDVSAFVGAFKTVQVGGTFSGNLVVEVSEDGTTEWAQPFSFQGPGAQSQTLIVRFMRVRRSGVTVAPGTPVVNVGFAAVAADGGSVTASVTNVKTFGATGDGVTNDLPAIQLAVSSAKITGFPLYFPPGQYKIAHFIYLGGFANFRIYGDEATILYPSDDTTVLGADFPQTAGVAAPNSAARAGFFLDQCSNVVIDKTLTFQGGSAQQISTVNVGSAVYARKTVGLDAEYWARFGAAPLQQEQTKDTTGTGISLTVVGDVVTLTAPASSFVDGFNAARSVTLGQTTNMVNSGTFPILAYVSPTQITFRHPGAVNEVSTFVWSIDDHDRLTDLKIHGYGCRAAINPCSNTVITGDLTQPTQGQDLTGVGDSLSISGTTVTLRDMGLTFDLLQNVVNRYVRIDRSTSGANNGWFKILSATPATLFTPGTLTFTNAAGVSEMFTGTWWIMNGDVSGIGAGAGAIAVSAGVVTFTSSTNAFDASMIGMVIRLADTPTAANSGAFVIRSVPAPNKVTFGNSAAVAEAFSKGWAIDSYDAAPDQGNSFGSSHGVYLFAGRSEVRVSNMTITGIRHVAVKVSGTNAPIHDVMVQNCTFDECGGAFVGGADDSQSHIDLTFSNNQVRNCGIGRPGWNEQVAAWFLGSTGSTCCNNTFYYSRNAISAVSGGVGSVAGNYTILAARQTPGVSQPVDNFLATGNQITRDLQATGPTDITTFAIRAEHVGMLARYRTGGTLTGPTVNPVTGATDVMTLSDSLGQFNAASMVGCDIELVFCASSANNVKSKILQVPGTSTLTFTNSSGVAGAVGTYRIQGPTGAAQLGGECTISKNQIHGFLSAISATNCVSPQITDNVIGGAALVCDCSQSLRPRIHRNMQIGSATNSAGIRLDSGTSWPDVGSNPISVGGNQLGAAQSHSGDLGIGVDSSTPVDHPLLGMRGRVVPTQAVEEVVFSYGSNLVDGDFFFLNGGIKYTFKATAPSGHQFNTMAGLIALINADGFVAADYGAAFAVPVTTGHIRVRSPVTSVLDNSFSIDTFNILNPTAIVAMRNRLGGGEAFLSSRGSGSAGPTPDKAVIWTPDATFAGNVVLIADNAAAQTLLQANGYRSINDVKDAGCCRVVTFGTSAGTEEFRWAMPD